MPSYNNLVDEALYSCFLLTQLQHRNNEISKISKLQNSSTDTEKLRFWYQCSSVILTWYSSTWPDFQDLNFFHIIFLINAFMLIKWSNFDSVCCKKSSGRKFRHSVRECNSKNQDGLILTSWERREALVLGFYLQRHGS